MKLLVWSKSKSAGRRVYRSPPSGPRQTSLENSASVKNAKEDGQQLDPALQSLPSTPPRKIRSKSSERSPTSGYSFNTQETAPISSSSTRSTSTGSETKSDSTTIQSQKEKASTHSGIDSIPLNVLQVKQKENDLNLSATHPDLDGTTPSKRPHLNLTSTECNNVPSIHLGSIDVTSSGRLASERVRKSLLFHLMRQSSEICSMLEEHLSNESTSTSNSKNMKYYPFGDDEVLQEESEVFFVLDGPAPSEKLTSGRGRETNSIITLDMALPEWERWAVPAVLKDGSRTYDPDVYNDIESETRNEAQENKRATQTSSISEDGGKRLVERVEDVRNFHEKLADCLQDGCYDDAVDLLTKSFLPNVHSSQHRHDATTMFQVISQNTLRNIGNVQFLAGHHADAVVTLEKGLKHRLSVDDADHRETQKEEDDADAVTLVVLGSAYYGLQKFYAAIRVYLKALAILEKLPEYEVFLAKLLNNIGCAFYEMKDHGKASKTFERALQLYENGRSDEQRFTSIEDEIITTCNLCNTLLKMKQYPAAMKMIKIAVKLQHMAPESVHCMEVSILDTFAFINVKMKHYAAALGNYTSILQIQADKSSCNPNTSMYHVDEIKTLSNMSYLYLKLREFNHAINCLRCILSHQERTMPLNHEDIVHTKASIAKVEALCLVEQPSPATEMTQNEV